MLEQSFKYFIDHQDELVKKYPNKYLVIVGEEVVGVYDSDEQAYFDSLSKYAPGTFLIQLCEAGESAYTQTFHTRVVAF